MKLGPYKIEYQLHMNLKKTFAILCLTSLCIGCSTTVEHSFYNWKNGWRKATVNAIGSAEKLPGNALSSCNKFKSAELKGKYQRFATLAYPDAVARDLHSFLINDDLKVKVGDRVYLNIDECLVHPIID